MQVQKLHEAIILCPICGVQFTPTLGNICQACTISSADITIGVTKETIVNYCRFCQRYMRPPWINCERDSKQLLALLLRKVRGLNKLKIINACFLWTEPHSKRIKVKITVEKQLSGMTKIEQTFVTEFIENYMQCEDCKKQFTPHTWGAVVQVRQHVEHKKTFFYIEQLILRHNAYDKVLKVSEDDDGINFYFKNITHAQRLIDFLNSLLPTTVKSSKQLVSHDMNSNLFNYKYTFSVQIPKICRNDLVILPKKLAKQLGGCSQLMLCWKISQQLGLVDLENFNYVVMTASQYYHYEKDIQLLPLSRYKSLFQVMDSNPVQKKKQQTQKSTLNLLIPKLCYYNVTRADTWQNIEVKAPLGLIHCSAFVQGFDLRYLSHTEDLDNLKGFQEIVLVRKVQEKKHGRAFKLKKLEEQGVMVEEKESLYKKKKSKTNKDDDYEDFMDDIQTDAALRKGIKLYKNEDTLKNCTGEQLKEVLGEMDLCELMDDLKIDEGKEKAAETLNEAEGIDQLINKMGEITIEKIDPSQNSQI